MADNWASKAGRRLRRFSFIKEVVSFLLLVGVIYFGIKGALILGLRTPSPMMGVVGTSMTHSGDNWTQGYENIGRDPSEFPFQGGLQPGDLVVIQGLKSPADLEVGDVVVREGSRGLIIHRIIETEGRDGVWYFKTKGDNNLFADSSVPFRDIVGKAIWSIPYLGEPTRWFQ